MTKSEREQLAEAHRELHELRQSMSREETMAFLQDAGLFDQQGRLARQYGGPGDETPSSIRVFSQDPPR